MSDEKPRATKTDTVVDHSYHDYSNDPVRSVDSINCSISTGHRVIFPAKLHAILSTPGYDHIIRWMPHGRSWRVIDKELLVSDVLKKHFNHDNFDSFSRQVNLWGFKVRMVCSFSDIVLFSHACVLIINPLRNEIAAIASAGDGL